MKTRKAVKPQNGDTNARQIIDKAALAQRIADAARKHLRALKVEYKQARKAFKQAKKAAKRARNKAEVATDQLRANGRLVRPQVNKARRRNFSAPKRRVSKRNPAPTSPAAQEPAALSLAAV